MPRPTRDAARVVGGAARCSRCRADSAWSQPPSRGFDSDPNGLDRAPDGDPHSGADREATSRHRLLDRIEPQRATHPAAPPAAEDLAGIVVPAVGQSLSDGRVVVGYSFLGWDYRPFRWSESRGYEELALPAGLGQGLAYAVASTGRAAGHCIGGNWTQAVTWDAAGVPHVLQGVREALADRVSGATPAPSASARPWGNPWSPPPLGQRGPRSRPPR